MYGYICPYCGDHLDPGERCECRNEKKESSLKQVKHCDRCGCVLCEDDDLITANGKNICSHCLDDDGRQL